MDLFLDLTIPNGGDWVQRRSLSKLGPSALQTLHTVKMKMYVILGASEFPVFAFFATEFAAIAGNNNLREVSIRVELGYGTTSDREPAWWAELDNIFSHGFPQLRNLHLQVYSHFWNASSGPFGDAGEPQRAEAKWKELFEKGLPWCRKNLRFKAEVGGRVT
jgi:hypothetical protein